MVAFMKSRVDTKVKTLHFIGVTGQQSLRFFILPCWAIPDTGVILSNYGAK